MLLRNVMRKAEWAEPIWLRPWEQVYYITFTKIGLE